jgi:16S rRNA (uracil1498-N3)-methyltransferase
VPQFFVTSPEIVDNRCRISGDDFRHLASVRRVRPGDALMLRDERGDSLSGRVVRVTDSFIEVEITGKTAGAPAPADITLCMCLLKGKNFDLVIEKAVEVGVSRIVPVLSERTIARPADAEARVRRWNRKAEEAAKQSLRGARPVIGETCAFTDLIAGERDRARVIAHPGAPGSLKQILRRERPCGISLLVGPEGGFSPREVAAAEAAGWTAAGIGFSQMRAGTAAIVLCGIIIYEWGERDESCSAPI